MSLVPAVAGALREGKLDEAVKISDRYPKSHLAKVMVAALQEFQAHQKSSDISGEEIDAYVGTGEPMDKAGAYAIQGGAAGFLLRIRGSLTNVIGMPMERLAEELNRISSALPR